MMSMGSDGNQVSSAKADSRDVDEYIPDLGGQTRYFVFIDVRTKSNLTVDLVSQCPMAETR